MKFLKWVYSWFGGPPAPALELVVAAQAATVKACGFLPAAASVVQIIGAMTGQAGATATVVGIAGTICKAVSATKAVSSLVGTDEIKPIVEIGEETIVVEGTFVEK